MNEAHPQFLRESQVLAELPFSRATLWRLIKNGRFPAPYKAGYVRISVWKKAEVEAFLASFVS